MVHVWCPETICGDQSLSLGPKDRLQVIRLVPLLNVASCWSKR